MPTLHILARVRVPNVPIDHQRVNQTVNLYWWDSPINPQQWAHTDDMMLVGTYLIRWRTEPYWEVILQGGVRGYSLYLHELTELAWYFAQDADPFHAQEQTAGYRAAHAEALVQEHRFLQVVARTMGYAFSLRELMTYNPHGDPPQDDWEGDWEVVLAQKQQDLSSADTILRPNAAEEAKKFYTRLGFREV